MQPTMMGKGLGEGNATAGVGFFISTQLNRTGPLGRTEGMGWAMNLKDRSTPMTH